MCACINVCIYTLADPDIRLGGDGSRHSAMGGAI